MSDSSLSLSIADDVAVISFDDGKVNVLSRAAMATMHEMLTEAEHTASALVFVGREGKFCAGFNLAEVQESPDAARTVMREGTALFTRIYMLGVPTVAACTGHALAAGAIWLMSCDLRIGPEAPAKIGLNEVGIGMSLPLFATAFAHDRLSKRHITAATALATLYSPAEAVDVGYLDAVVPPDDVVGAAAEAAGRFAAAFHRDAFGQTRVTMRGSTVDGINAALDEDLAAMILPEPT